MGSLFPLTLVLLSLTSSAKCELSQGFKSAQSLDLSIRDYSFHSYKNYFKTGTFHTVNLPANLSSITVNAAKFRCGSLRRYGAQAMQLHLPAGVTVYPCVERVMLVVQNLGLDWSYLYNDSYDLTGYQLVSPVFGLLAYNADNVTNSSKSLQVGILALWKNPISLDFGNTTIMDNASGLIPLCASFGRDAKVTLSNQVGPNACAAFGDGHFGLVVESPLVPERRPGKVSGWKLVVGTSVGAALGAFLLCLLLIALFVKVKKKARIDEMERRAYEEEALQVTMVGHVRAHTASGTRTVPVIEHHYRPSPY